MSLPQYKKRAGVVSSEIDGSAVLLDLEQSRYFGLNTVGLFVWERLEAPITVAQLCEDVSSKFDVSSGICELDVKNLLQALCERGLVDCEASSES